jgi:hypothetical protein
MQLREGVRALQVPKGLLLHDPMLWKLFLLPPGASAEKMLREAGLDEGAPVPAARPRTRQIYWVTPDYAPSRELRILEGSRFSCVTCGESCRSMKLGPLLPEDVTRLQELDWSGTGRDPSQFFIDPDGEPVNIDDWAGSCELFLRRTESARGGRQCQFLREDNLCDVHARFGMAAKPLMCRVFPWFFRATPTGMAVGMRIGDCLSSPRSSVLQPVGEQRDELLGLLNEVFEIGLVPPSVWLSDGKLLPYEEYEAREREWLAAPAPPHARVPGFAALLFRALAPDAQPAAPEAVELFVRRAKEHEGRPLRVVAGPSQPLGAEALAFEDRACRQFLFNKELFQSPTLALGAAAMVLRTFLARLETPEGTPAALNQAMSKFPGRPLSELCEDVDPLALAARILA